MENTEEVFQCLDEFVKRKPKTIPRELEEYLSYVARTGDPVYQWPLVKYLFKEKLLNVITDFYETSPGLDIPHCPNVDPFNYDTMKNSLLERLDAFSSAPFTVQRISELLTTPRKQYNRIDKFMRAIEKNVLVVSTREPGIQRHSEPENGEQMESMVNGSDNTSDYNVDVEMEDMSWKENPEQSQPKPSSSEGHISVDDIEARLQAKELSAETPKVNKEYESVTPPELNVSTDEIPVDKPTKESMPAPEKTHTETDKEKTVHIDESEAKVDNINEPLPTTTPLIIPEIRVEDAEMTEQSLQAKTAIEDKQPSEISKPTELNEDSNHSDVKEDIRTEPVPTPPENNVEQEARDSESSDTKHFSEISTSSEESSSSSDNTDGNSNSPKPDTVSNVDVQEETTHPDNIVEPTPQNDKDSTNDSQESNKTPEISDDDSMDKTTPQQVIQTDDYSISDVKSEIAQVAPQEKAKSPEKNDHKMEVKTEFDSEVQQTNEQAKPETSELQSDTKEPLGVFVKSE